MGVTSDPQSASLLPEEEQILGSLSQADAGHHLSKYTSCIQVPIPAPQNTAAFGDRILAEVLIGE